MKNIPLLIIAALFGSIVSASADLVIPSDGSDGALNITQDTVIDLNNAITGTWNQNNSANAGNGVYDPEKWAIVFKYSSVNIAGHTTGTPAALVGRTVRFINHWSHAPVVWLVQGSVTIAGKLDLTGANDPGAAISRLLPADSGPGGFRGGAIGPLGTGNGYGPGGGDTYRSVYQVPGNYASVYGNPQIIPLIGGSGSSAWDGYGGAGGGGAIFIAAARDINVTGQIDASGGHQYSWAGDNRGSGGAIRLVAENVFGGIPQGSGLVGNLLALPGGRIRIEALLSPAVIPSPETIGVPPTITPIIWPAANAPKARVVSVDSRPAPADPASKIIASADVAIQNNAPVNILIETRDFPIEGVVQLAVIPKFGARTWLPATRVNGNINVATWQVTTTLPNGFVTLQARATQP